MLYKMDIHCVTSFVGEVTAHLGRHSTALTMREAHTTYRFLYLYPELYKEAAVRESSRQYIVPSCVRRQLYVIRKLSWVDHSMYVANSKHSAEEVERSSCLTRQASHREREDVTHAPSKAAEGRVAMQFAALSRFREQNMAPGTV